MSGQNQPPYRMPCEGVAGKPLYFFGAPFQHAIGNWKADKYVNTTEVANWDTEVGGTISPYEKYQDNSGDDTCQLNLCNPSAAPCGQWLYPFPDNTFGHTPGDQVDFAVGHKRGWKGVQGARNWHGILPWTAPEAGCPTNLCDDGVHGYQVYQPNPSQTKYRSVNYSIEYHADWEDIEFLTRSKIDSALTGQRDVNAQSGEITSSLATSEDTYDINADGDSTQTKHADRGAGWTEADSVRTDYAKGMTTVLDPVPDNDLHCGHVTVPEPFLTFGDQPAATDIVGLISLWNAAYPSNAFPLPTDPNSYDHTVTNVDATFGGGTITQSISYRISWSRSDTAYTFEVDYEADYTGSITAKQTANYSGTVALLNGYGGDTVLADIYNNLLSLWPLNDDKLHPWRTDQKGSIAPYVTRNELGTTSPLGFNTYTVDDLTQPINDSNDNAPFSPDWVSTYEQRDWFDPRVYQWQFAAGTDASNSAATGLLKLFDGAILGAPKPAGYQDYFDFKFTDIRGCCYEPGDGSKTWEWYPVGFGMTPSAFNTLAGTQIPLNATQWNNWMQAANKPLGAWIIYADQKNYFPDGCVSSAFNASAQAGDAAAIVACKYAEVLEQWPSQNFALPAGDMKFWYDETRVYCATNVSGDGEGSQWSLTDPKTGVSPTTAPEVDDYWGGPSVGGFYAITGWDGTIVTLGAKKFDVPSNWASKSHHDDSACFGPLRWHDYPSLLGRVGVTPHSDATYTFGTAQPAFGISSSHQEQIDLYDSSMTLLASNVTATRIDDSTFSTGTAYLDAAFVQIHGAAKWYMNDGTPKGDVTVLQWWFDYRNGGTVFGLNSEPNGRSDCDGNPIAGPDTLTYNDYDCNGGSVTVDFPGHGFAKFCQTPACVPSQPCAPRVVCISPNGETWSNGVTFGMPTNLVWDSQYGSRYQAVVESTMVDLFWQPPHFPCSLKSCTGWIMDTGACVGDLEVDCPTVGCGDDEDCDSGSIPPKYYYPLSPLVEARLTLPNNYGAAQNETAPALPAGITVGWVSPVNNDGTTVASVALPPNPPGPSKEGNGLPGGCLFTWSLHQFLCDAAAADCRFGYNYPGC